jgi:hypothetical protein
MQHGNITHAASDLTSVFAFTMYKFYFSITYYYEQKVYKVMVKLLTNKKTEVRSDAACVIFPCCI